MTDAQEILDIVPLEHMIDVLEMGCLRKLVSGTDVWYQMLDMSVVISRADGSFDLHQGSFNIDE